MASSERSTPRFLLSVIAGSAGGTSLVARASKEPKSLLLGLAKFLIFVRLIGRSHGSIKDLK